MSNSRGRNRPDPAATSVTARSATVDSTLPVPPPFTNSRSATCRTRRTTSARRCANSARAFDCISRIAADRSGRPGTASPTPATWPSYAISPTTSKPRRAFTVSAKRPNCSGVRNGERRAPTRTRPPSRWSEVSSSRHTRTVADPSRAASIRSSCATSSTSTVT